MMPVAMTLSLTAVVVLAVQFLIFAYLYRSNRVRYFRYILWAWGCFVGSKGAEALRHLLPDVGFNGASLALGIVGDFLILASALAFRGSYSIRRTHALIVVAYAVLVASRGPLSFPGYGAGVGGLVNGLVLVASALIFWPWRREPSAAAGRRFLAISLALWGLHRMVAPLLGRTSDSAFVATNVSFVFIYYLIVFAIVIVVLDRARREAEGLKEFNERLIDGLGEGLQLVDETLTVRHANRWLGDHLGVRPGARCHEALTADGRPCPGCPLVESRGAARGAGAPSVASATLHVTGPGDRRFELTCTPVRQPDGRVFLLDLVADVTEQERMRSRLTEAERLASVGELAAGMAHEIRNPLAAIVNATALLEGEPTLGVDERAATIGALRKEARRLNAILSDFLRFARPAEPKRVEADVRDVVSHVAALVGEHQTRAPALIVETRVDDDVPRFAFDPDQLTQVLWNVSLNAIEAMKGRGRLLIHGRREGDETVLEVADSGPGIAAEELRRIFEPFYSRRPGGTGLGLPIARRIVAAHGGRIDVSSIAGEGTRVLIRLPVA